MRGVSYNSPILFVNILFLTIPLMAYLRTHIPTWCTPENRAPLSYGGYYGTP